MLVVIFVCPVLFRKCLCILITKQHVLFYILPDHNNHMKGPTILGLDDMNLH